MFDTTYIYTPSSSCDVSQPAFFKVVDYCRRHFYKLIQIDYKVNQKRRQLKDKGRNKTGRNCNQPHKACVQNKAEL